MSGLNGTYPDRFCILNIWSCQCSVNSHLEAESIQVSQYNSIKSLCMPAAGALSRLGPAPQCGGPAGAGVAPGWHRQSGAAWQDQHCWGQVGAKPQRGEKSAKLLCQRTLPISGHCLNCPGKLPLAGAAAPPAQPPLHKYLLWQQKSHTFGVEEPTIS